MGVVHPELSATFGNSFWPQSFERFPADCQRSHNWYCEKVLSTIVSLLLAAVETTMVVPLPPSFEGDADHRGNEDYQAVPNLKGIYAHGNAGQTFDGEFDGPPCKGSEAEQRQFLASLPADGRSEFWYYATKQQAILLSRSASVATDKACGAALSHSYSVERAFVSDGFIHSVSADGSNQMEAIGTWPTAHSAGMYASDFERIQSLTARTRGAPSGRRQEPDLIAGVRAICGGMSGLVWSSVCVAESGPAKGMLLRAQSGDDERMFFSMEIKELRTNVMLPGILFEVDRTWVAKR